MPMPHCFDSPKMWSEYVTLGRMTSLPPKHGFCVDCTPEYKQRMEEEERCEHKDVEFMWVVDRKDGSLDLQGRRTKHMTPNKLNIMMLRVGR